VTLLNYYFPRVDVRNGLSPSNKDPRYLSVPPFRRLPYLAWFTVSSGQAQDRSHVVIALYPLNHYDPRCWPANPVRWHLGHLFNPT